MLMSSFKHTSQPKITLLTFKLNDRNYLHTQDPKRLSKSERDRALKERRLAKSKNYPHTLSNKIVNQVRRTKKLENGDFVSAPNDL